MWWGMFRNIILEISLKIIVCNWASVRVTSAYPLKTTGTESSPVIRGHKDGSLHNKIKKYIQVQNHYYIKQRQMCFHFHTPLRRLAFHLKSLDFKFLQYILRVYFFGSCSNINDYHYKYYTVAKN